MHIFTLKKLCEPLTSWCKKCLTWHNTWHKKTITVIRTCETEQQLWLLHTEKVYNTSQHKFLYDFNLKKIWSNCKACWENHSHQYMRNMLYGFLIVMCFSSFIIFRTMRFFLWILFCICKGHCVFFRLFLGITEKPLEEILQPSSWGIFLLILPGSAHQQMLLDGALN